jgi:predicted dehydrogenase
MKRYRVAVVGTGGIARTHAQGWQSTKRCDLVAGVDIRPESAAKFAQEFSVPSTYGDVNEMLSKEKPDIVSICTWHGTHPTFTVAAANAGVLAILCEKPMAVNLGDADAMLEAVAKSGSKLAIGHHHRFSARNTEARRIIASGAIGKPHLLRLCTGGGLTNNGTHAIDRARYLLGDPKAEWVIGQVERRTDRYERLEPIEDSCAGLVAFEGGTRLVIESDLPDGGLNDKAAGFTTLQVYGTEGTLAVGGGLYLLNAASNGWQSLDAPPDTNQFEEMLGWIEGKNAHRNEGTTARATVELMMAIYESARIRGRVSLPLTTMRSPLVMMIEDGSLRVEKEGRYDIRVPNWQG